MFPRPSTKSQHRLKRDNGSRVLATTPAVVRRADGIYALERTLHRRGFATVAGADEAGRGACAGPLVVAAVVLPPSRRSDVEGLADSKMMTPAIRDRVFESIMEVAIAHSVVIISSHEIDNYGVHLCNVTGMRRALATLTVQPEYVLTDGFGVDGLCTPGLAVWKGDRVAACVAAASIVAKVTRDRIMIELGQAWPEYGFSIHKGYGTREHSEALKHHGPCPHHRFSYANVAAVAQGTRVRSTVGVASSVTVNVTTRIGENVSMGGGPQ